MVSSINEWKIAQPRVLVLTRSAYYRVTYSHKHGRIDHYQKTSLGKLKVLEKTATGLKVYTTEQDGNASIGKRFSSMFSKKKEVDEFEHAREYLPVVPITGGSCELLVDVIAAAFHKAAELHAVGDASAIVPHILTTGGRKQVLADRKEAARLEAERIEREGATDELTKAVAAAKESRSFDGLFKPIKRAKKAAEVDPSLISTADELLNELQEEKRERELQVPSLAQPWPYPSELPLSIPPSEPAPRVRMAAGAPCSREGGAGGGGGGAVECDASGARVTRRERAGQADQTSEEGGRVPC